MMPMNRFVCWKPERLGKVLNPVATQVKDDVFLAIHSPMLVREGTVDTQDIVVDESAVLARFGEVSRAYTFIPVIGASGSGKSHLIRWLAARFPSTESRRTLLVPKLNTNLRDFVQLLLRDLEGDEFDTYRNRLAQAPSGMGNRARVREDLLSYLATAVGPNAHDGLERDASLAGYICHSLPNLLHDPHFRSNYWLREGGIIDQLVEHTFGHRDAVDDRETRREFSVADLPLDLRDVGKAGEAARDFFSFLVPNSEAQDATVDWLNKNLDEAIARVLNFTGTDLQRLMTDVRKDLARRGIELVVLIEDFAVLQGIDLALLEALVAEPWQFGDGEPLCAIRTALACTTGYFKGLADTVRGRTTVILNVDLPVRGEGASGYRRIEDFSSRYLNAARLSPGDLEDWYSQAIQADEPVAPPNACSSCTFREECHSAFGEVEGRGLYPFNAAALENIFNRMVGKGADFNPRSMINGILSPTLGDYRDIEEGGFPSPHLRLRYGGSGLSAEVAYEVRRRDRENADRRLVLLDLWDGSDKVVDLHPVLHAAFDLPELGVEFVPTPRRENRPAPSPATDVDDLPRDLAEDLRLVDEWRNETGNLAERLREKLRDLVFDALKERIDWDSEGLTRSFFDRAGGYFRKTSVNFRRQQINVPAAHLQATVVIPSSIDGITSAALALKGALRAKQCGHWRFPGGGQAFREFANLIDECSLDILRQLRNPLIDQEVKWDPIPLAVDLLCTGVRLDGSPAKAEPSVPELVEALFKKPVAPLDGRTPEFKRLHQYVAKRRTEIVSMIRAFVSCSKGGNQGPYIDPSRLAKAVERFSKTWVLSDAVPTPVADQYRPLIEAREKLVALEPVLAAEQRRAREWQVKVIGWIGDTREAEALASSIEHAAAAAYDAGLFRLAGGGTREELLRMTSAFKQTPLATTLNEVDAVIKAQSGPDLCYFVGRLDVSACMSIEAFLSSADRFLSDTTKAVESDFSRLGGDEAELEEIEKAIGNQIQDLEVMMRNLAGESA